MTFLDFPLALGTCTFECACTVDVLEDIVLLHLVESKEDSNAISKKHDLGRIVARCHRRSRLIHGRRKRGALHEHRGVHGQTPAFARLAFKLALFRVAHASVGGRRASQAPGDDVPVVREALLGRAARDEVRARVPVLFGLRHVRQTASVGERGNRGAYFGRGAVAGE